MSPNERDPEDDDLSLIARQLAEMRRELESAREDLGHQRNLTQLAQEEVRALKRSWSYRVGRVIVGPASGAKIGLRLLRQWRSGRGPGIHRFSPATELRPGEEARLNLQYRRLRRRPVFSLLVPVYNTPAGVLRDTIDSVFRQIHEEWELVLVDDRSTDETTLGILQEYAARDPRRVKVSRNEKNLGIALTTNRAAELATGPWLGLLDHDDILTPDALLQMALKIEAEPEADFIYSDEDKLNAKGRLVDAFHKPDFSPAYLLCNNYLCHFSVFRRELYTEVGGFREGFDGSQDFDLFLRMTEKARRVEHVPRILYHWRMVPGSTAADPAAKGGLWRETSKKALAETIARRGWDAQVENGLVTGTYRVRFNVDPKSRVVVVIPTKDRLDLLRRCVASVRARTAGCEFEILVVSNNSERAETFRYLDEETARGGFRWIRDDEPFNFSRLNNRAVRESDAPYLLFLNNDMEVISSEWMTAMLEYASQSDVGAVGAKLLYPDDRIQHAGIVLGMKGVAGHVFKKKRDGDPGYFGQIDMVREVGAVTAACMMMRREVFDEIGGFDGRLAVAFNDVDLCLRVLRSGRRIVYTPYARLYHYESASRGDDESPEHYMRFRAEIAAMVGRWGRELYTDPWYNPNLSMWHDDCRRRGSDENERVERYLEEFSNWNPKYDREFRRRRLERGRAGQENGT